MFDVPLDAKQVILGMLFPDSLMASTKKLLCVEI